MSYLYILATVLCTVYSQVILKWRVSLLPEKNLTMVLKLLFDPYVISGLAAAFIAALFWMMALTKLPLSWAYPFTSLSFVLIVLLSVWLFHEPLTLHKVGGLACIIIGLVILSRSI